MHNFVTVVFDDRGKTYAALHALWEMDAAATITVHGTATVHRDDWGRFEVDTKETHPVMATAIGVGIGALLGAFAGPAGLAVGIAEGAAVASGAVAGGLMGGLVDLDRSDSRHEAEVQTRVFLGRGQSAIIADVTEDSEMVLDSQMKNLGGTVHRWSKNSLLSDAAFDDSYFLSDTYLYPYEYVPSRYLRYSW